jgi:hypothetical protein
VSNSVARRQFLRQGQLAGSAVGGIVAAMIVGLLPAQARLVEVSDDLNTGSLLDITRWMIPIVVGMAIGYLGWLAIVEHRRPSLRGGGWTSERDWAVTGGLFVAFLLTRLFVLGDGAAQSGVHATADPAVSLLVDAPIDIARAMVRFLASASIAAILLRLVFQAVEPWRARRRAGSSSP